MWDNKNWKLIDKIWKTIDDACSEYKVNYPQLVFNKDKKDDFNIQFQKHYLHIKKCHMTEDTGELDSHKQAAIITICCLELDIIECNIPNLKENELNIIPQMIAINVGLSYMLNCLNRSLKKHKIEKRISSYYLPVAFACKTKYEKIMCRILYQEQHEENMKFNVLELSDRYFLLEYINLLQHGIEPSLLKEND